MLHSRLPDSLETTTIRGKAQALPETPDKTLKFETMFRIDTKTSKLIFLKPFFK
ncbi:MAG: hypothetical protein H5T85_06175 [Actinobacteria bacterium]|nr:hypothetical protein [Actinomycetota bacterium]